jgi:hypothetical protein
VLAVIFGLIIFFTLWALFFGAWVNTWAQQMITVNSLTGVEAFFVANMNLWIGVGVLIGSVSMLYLGR